MSWLLKKTRNCIWRIMIFWYMLVCHSTFYKYFLWISESIFNLIKSIKWICASLPISSSATISTAVTRSTISGFNTSIITISTFPNPCSAISWGTYSSCSYSSVSPTTSSWMSQLILFSNSKRLLERLLSCPETCKKWSMPF